MIAQIQKRVEQCRGILDAILRDEYDSNEHFEKRIEEIKNHSTLEESYLIDDVCIAYKLVEEAALGCENCPFKKCEDFSEQNAIKYDALVLAYIALKHVKIIKKKS
ncbi:hypothetical protein IJI94_01865 [Candidatus Saccharibacteria bacterium]|nr:hypothetical protein [Candidatus Saccharibacteria bacterium]